MNEAQDRIAALYAAALAETPDPDAATDRVLDRLAAAPSGPWQACRVNLPSAMASDVLSRAEELDGALAIWKHHAAKGEAGPLPFPLPPDDPVREVVDDLFAGCPIQLASLLQTHLLWKQVSSLPNFREGDPTSILD